MRVVEVVVAGHSRHRDNAPWAPREVVPAVAITRLKHARYSPGEGRCELHMLLKDETSHCRREETSQVELNWMDILRGKSDCVYVLMMNLMKALIEKRLMQKLVNKVSGKIFTDHTEQDISSEMLPVWNIFYCK